MILLQESHFLHGLETIESGAKPFVICTVPYCKIGNTDRKEKKNQQRKDGCPAGKTLQFQPVNQQIEKNEEKGNGEKVTCPACLHPFPV